MIGQVETLAQYIVAMGGFVVSEATMRAFDLIPAFTAVLAELAPEDAARLRGEYTSVYQAVEHGGPDWDACDDDEVGWCMEALFDALDAAAPEGYVFSAHVGDGACYGFWAVATDDEQ